MNAAAPVAAHFDGVPGSVARARQFVASAIGLADPELCDAVLVIVSELVSNAVVHGASDFTVQVEDVVGGVRVTVADSGPGHPVLRRPTPSELHGRGLQIVEQLSSSWGVVPAADGRKAVWFEVHGATG